MDSRRLIFDSATSGHMLILGGGGGGGGGNTIFRARSVFGLEDGTNSSGKRRPFFTSPEELLEEEYYDEQLPEKKRRLTPDQVHLLERSFEEENKLEPERKSELAKKLGLQPRQVAVWFQNRRARWKTKQLERDFDRLKSSHDSLLADHDALLKDNDRLRSQVISLTEKLQGRKEQLNGPPATDESVGLARPPPKGEDHLSTGSGGSAVLDEVEGPQQLVDSCSGESYLHDSFHHVMEDDVSGGGGGGNAGCNYLPGAAMFEESQHADSFWVWG